MFDSYRVVAATPAGRKRYLEVLVRYLLAERPLIDEYHVWVNTTNAEDLAYCEALQRAHPDFIRLIWPDPEFKKAYDVVAHKFGLTQQHIGAVCTMIGAFYEHCRDLSTIYVRFDDDICFVAPGAVETLLKFRVAHPSFFGVYANIVNQPTCTYIHQRLGMLGLEEGVATIDPLCPVGWEYPPVAELAHETLLRRIRDGRLDEMTFDKWIVPDYTRMSINCLAWFGRDLASVQPFTVPFQEELWLSSDLPKKLKRPNAICGQSIVAHFAYFTQRDYLEQETSLLSRYRVLAGIEEAVPVG